MNSEPSDVVALHDSSIETEVLGVSCGYADASVATTVCLPVRGSTRVTCCWRPEGETTTVHRPSLPLPTTVDGLWTGACSITALSAGLGAWCRTGTPSDPAAPKW